jgi:uncharacterized membrane protein YcaP (DUF421 family)
MTKTTRRVIFIEGLILMFAFGRTSFAQMTTFDHVAALCGAGLLLLASLL